MLLLDSSVCGLFKWRQFEPEMILVAVGWYLRFYLTYRDIEELLNERLRADHVTVWRWVQISSPPPTFASPRLLDTFDDALLNRSFTPAKRVFIVFPPTPVNRAMI
jgi:hypothetical protein